MKPEDDTKPSELAWERINLEFQEKGFKGETGKCRERRLREQWFERFAPSDKIGIDIGCQEDPINDTFRRFDWVYGDGDATDMIGVPNDTFWTVYASHVLEHLKFPQKAIRRWYEITRPGGHLIILVPHRDLYEKKRYPPSNWNPEHAYFWLPDHEDPPMTKCLRKEVQTAIPNADIVLYRVLDEGFDYSIPPDCHSVGEYSIECVVRKPEK